MVQIQTRIIQKISTRELFRMAHKHDFLKCKLIIRKATLP